MPDQRLRALVPFGTSPSEIAYQLRSIGVTISGAAEWITSSRERDERNLILFNLLVAPLPYLDLFAQNLSGPLPVLAFCTRTVFELNVRLRHILLSDDHLRRWMAEAANDRIELLQAFISVGEADDSRVQILRVELDRIDALKSKHKLPELRRSDKQMATIARQVGLEHEYRSLFKIFSKLVHPTSYLVNSGNVMNDTQMRDVLLIHFQLYVLDLLKRVTDEMNVPTELTVYRGDGSPGAPPSGGGNSVCR